MSIENKEGFQGPMSFTIKSATPAGKNGKNPPFKDIPKWYVKCPEYPNLSLSIYQKEQPKDGDVHADAWVKGSEYQGKWYFEIYTKDQKASGGGGGGRGVSVMMTGLTPDQEMMDKAIGHAIGCIQNGLIAGDSAPVPATMANLDKLADWAFKKISTAKKGA